MPRLSLSFLLLTVLVFFLGGCVGSDSLFMKSPGDLPVGAITSEQRQQIRSAAASGDPDLIAATARMAWDDPQNAISLADYAANLRPERAEEIAAAVTLAVQR